MNYGFIKACAVSPALRVADCPYNAQETIEAMQQAAEDGCQLTVFPELGLTGYTCGDLFAAAASRRGRSRAPGDSEGKRGAAACRARGASGHGRR